MYVYPVKAPRKCDWQHVKHCFEQDYAKLSSFAEILGCEQLPDLVPIEYIPIYKASLIHSVS